MRILHRIFSTYKLLPLFQAARARELQLRPSRAEKAIAKRYGVSPTLARAIARANGYGPEGGAR